MRLGALEAGGTKMVLAMGDETGKIFDRISIPTETPEKTMPQIVQYFEEHKPEAIGIGCFGPVDVREASNEYGKILDTPKLAWRQYNIRKTIADALRVPVTLDTDVNGSCLGEMTYGEAKGIGNVLYITIGTGIGAGIAVDGKLVHGMLHPEAGHILLPIARDDTYEGKCPYHKHCFEGLAAGPALAERAGKNAALLQETDPIWDLEADYIAQALMNYICIVSPQRIILGGGVMHQQQLFPKIRKKVTEYLAGYLRTPELEDMEHYIVPASLGDDQGILGCFALAMRNGIQD